MPEAQNPRHDAEAQTGHADTQQEQLGQAKQSPMKEPATETSHAGMGDATQAANGSQKENLSPNPKQNPPEQKSGEEKKAAPSEAPKDNASKDDAEANKLQPYAPATPVTNLPSSGDTPNEGPIAPARAARRANNPALDFGEGELLQAVPVSSDVYNDAGMDSTVDTDGKNFDAKHREPGKLSDVSTNATVGDNLPEAFPGLGGGDSRLGGSKPLIAPMAGRTVTIGDFLPPIRVRNAHDSKEFIPFNHSRPSRSFTIEGLGLSGAGESATPIDPPSAGDALVREPDLA